MYAGLQLTAEIVFHPVLLRPLTVALLFALIESHLKTGLLASWAGNRSLTFVDRIVHCALLAMGIVTLKIGFREVLKTFINDSPTRAAVANADA